MGRLVLASVVGGFHLSGMVSVQFKYSKECFLGYFNRSDLLHSFLAFFLFFQQLTFTGDVASVAFGGNVLSHSLNGLSRYYFCAYGGLNGNVELLAWYKLLEFFAHPASGTSRHCRHVSMSTGRPRFHR